uniref:Uncharacterized protein n=1 Tax=Salix viminalis TaxID=40686 RepID=A0A6N2MMH0_SALVM
MPIPYKPDIDVENIKFESYEVAHQQGGGTTRLKKSKRRWCEDDDEITFVNFPCADVVVHPNAVPVLLYQTFYWLDSKSGSTLFTLIFKGLEVSA